MPTVNYEPLVSHCRRINSAIALSRCLQTHGKHHPATWAAYARAHHAWEGTIRPPDCLGSAPWMELAKAYTTADLRAHGDTGWMNRAMRKAKKGWGR